MYYCKLVHSPYAHANIVSIDFSEALKVPGVKGVLTGQDFPEGHNLGNPEAFKELADKEPLCRKKVRMVGDEVAAVCAISEEIATEAAALVKVEYEPLPPVLDPFESMAPDAPAIHYPDSSNLSIFTVMKAGDTEKAFAEADYTDRHYYQTQEMVHAAIEPHGAVAKYENGEWTVWTTTQGAYVSRYWIAWGLGVPESQVRVIKPMVGGGFGGKLDVFAHELCPCKFAQMTGHPVKCILKRDEVFDLHIDPLQLRRQNGITPYYTGPTGLEFTSCQFDEALVKCAEAIDWEHRDKYPIGSGEAIGLSGSGFMSGTGFPVLVTPHYCSSSTIVRLNREGYAVVFSGANDIGQGCDTVMTMIVAEEWGCKPSDITMKDHRVFIKGDAEKNISYNEACFGYEEKNFGRCVAGVGSFAHEGDKDIYVKNVGNYATAYSFSASAAKVKVDMETGAVELQDFVFGHDCERPLNLRAVEGQIEGSVLLGYGFTCYEECVYNKEGKHMNPSFRDYRFPTALDMPHIKTIICSEADPEGPMGAKEAGEGSTAPVGSAIGNAINYATGLTLRELPITPEKLWRALKEHEKTGKTCFGAEDLPEKFAAMPPLPQRD